MSPPRGIKRWCCMISVCLSDVCLSRTSGLSRERRSLGRLKLAHVTCDSDITLKVKRSKVKVTRPLWLAVLAGQHGHRVSNGSRCMYDVYRVTTCRPGRGHVVAASRLQLVILKLRDLTRSHFDNMRKFSIIGTVRLGWKGNYGFTPQYRIHKCTYEKRSEETQTLRAGCLYLQTQFGEDRCMQFRVIVVTDPQTHKHTDRTDYNTLRCSLARSATTLNIFFWRGRRGQFYPHIH